VVEMEEEKLDYLLNRIELLEEEVIDLKAKEKYIKQQIKQQKGMKFCEKWSKKR